jgi:hypothetical protein
MADRTLKDRSVGRHSVETLVERKETISCELAPRSENNASQRKASVPIVLLFSSSPAHRVLSYTFTHC